MDRIGCLYSPWNSPGHNTGVGSQFPSPGIFPTQGSNPGLRHCRQILCQLSHKGSPSEVKVVQYCLTRCNPINYTVHGILQARILEWVTFSLEDFQGNLPSPGIEPRSPTLQVDSLPAEPQGKPKNTGMGSLSLLQRIFLTQESNRGLLHCRRSLPTELSGKPILWL